MRCDFHFALWEKEYSLVMKSAQNWKQFPPLFSTLSLEESQSRAWELLNLEQFTVVQGRWISLPLWSLTVCLWFPDTVFCFIYVTSRFPERWQLSLSCDCHVLQRGACPGRALWLHERRKECIAFVKGSALPCLQKGAEPTLKTCRLYIHLLSHAERKAEQLRRPKSYSLEKLQSRVVALVTCSPKDWAGEANLSKPSCEWAATLCFALVHEGVGFPEGASGVSLTLAVR